MDKYTRFVLTAIAVAVWGLLLVHLGESPRSVFGEAVAQPRPAPTSVVIVGWQLPPNPAAGFPVRITGTSGNVPIDIASIFGGSALPVVVSNKDPIVVREREKGK